MNTENRTVQHRIILMVCIIATLLPLNNIQAQILEPVSGRSIAVDSILPADVLARAYLLSDEIDLIRLELGKPKSSSELEIVSSASPREVYFQAQTSFIKANRLLYEQTGSRNTVALTDNVAEIQPFHVWLVVNQTYEQIIKVKSYLKIKEQIIEKEQADYTLPSDVFSQVSLVNSQLNTLLIQQFTPSDVYKKTNEAIHLMASLLATAPTVKRIPSAHAFERRKTPTDVYSYFIKTRAILIDIMKYYDVNFAHFKDKDKDKVPGDVYDLASLMVANLHYIHSLKSSAKPPAKTYLVGNKTPSHVYQRVSVLHQQIVALQQLHLNDSNWLSH